MAPEGQQRGHLRGVGRRVAVGVDRRALGQRLALATELQDVAQREQARSVSNAARDTFVETQDAAAREIVMASNTLRTALAAHAAARALTSAAATTYDAAFQSYKSGIATVTDATAADTGLLDARVAQADAHAAALVAAATVAFALGAMTTPDG